MSQHSAAHALTGADPLLQGVKGLLQQAGFTVYNPTLPYHSPTNAWNIADGQVSCQIYVDALKKVSLALCRRDAATQPRLLPS